MTLFGIQNCFRVHYLIVSMQLCILVYMIDHNVTFQDELANLDVRVTVEEKSNSGEVN